LGGSGLVAHNANITGTINATSGSFTGNVYTGYLSAWGGTIGGWTISSGSLSGYDSETKVTVYLTPYGVEYRRAGGSQYLKKSWV
jgi:hypothetical protein